MSASSQIRIGTSGWNYAHWRGRFYPEDLPASRWFEHYRQVFDTVEINNTFYHLPETSTFDGWKKQAPPHFLYAVKANRYLTHIKKLKDAPEPLHHFIERARHLGDHLGPILYQLPPRWKPNLKRLEEFLDCLPSDLIHVVEFREPAWLSDEVFGLLEQAGTNLCIHDLIDSHPRRLTGKAAYVRFHGAGSKYGGSYSKPQLRDWAKWMREVEETGHRVYAYFNNDANAYAVANALTLRDLITPCK